MTKSWDQVREMVCKLYLHEGRPLSETRRIVLRERGFTASDRAYRMKLKEWNVKRGDLAPKTAPLVGREDESSSDVDSHESHTKRSHSDRSIDPEPHVPGLDGEDELDEDDDNSRQQAFSELFAAVQGLRFSQRIFPLFNDLEFLDYSETFLHHAVQRPDTTSVVVQSVVKFLQMSRRAVDYRNEDGITALELAIRSDNVDSVSVLLAAGASVHSRNPDAQQPLHVALLSSLSKKREICVLLLVYGADLLSPLGDAGHVLKLLPPDVPDAGLHDWQIDLEVFVYVFKQMQQTFARQDGFNTRNTVAFERFLESLDRPLPSHPVVKTLLSSTMKFFMVLGQDPTSPAAAFDRCPAGHCRSWISMHLSHSLGVSFAETIMEHAPKESVPRLVEAIIKPCPHRSRSVMDTDLAVLLTLSLQRDVQIHRLDNPISTLLKHCPNDDPEKPGLLEALLQSQLVDIHAWDQDLRRPVSHLLEIDEPLKWHLAEIMVLRLAFAPWPEPTGADTGLTAATFALQDHDQLTPQRLNLLCAYLRGCRHWTYENGALCHMPPPPPPPPRASDADCHCETSAAQYQPTYAHLVDLYRCIVHAHTRAMVQNRPFGPAQSLSAARLVSILRKRDELGLPSLAIHNRSFVALLNNGPELG